ncbi:MAG TPA: methyltransferase domain-containing protein [Gaiellales bacterium]|nr:methyltransferase domain-containing protein [Gaiellales bacterium]
MEWPWEMVERDHVIQDPTSWEKIRLLGEYVRLTADSKVLDMGCGKAGPAVVLAEAFGCRILGVELREVFAAEARARVKERGLERLIDVRTADAVSFALEPDFYDVAMAIGTCFIWGHIEHAARALVPAVKRGGYLALGEPYWRSEPAVGVDREPFVSLPETVARLESAGVHLTGIIAASQDDWDRYESLHWRAVEEWLAANPGHADVASIRDRHRASLAAYLEHQRPLLGWAILVARKH